MSEFLFALAHRCRADDAIKPFYYTCSAIRDQFRFYDIFCIDSQFKTADFFLTAVSTVAIGRKEREREKERGRQIATKKCRHLECTFQVVKNQNIKKPSISIVMVEICFIFSFPFLA